MTQDEARAREMVEAVYRSDSRRVLATLIRLLGDFDLAEEAMHEALHERAFALQHERAEVAELVLVHRRQ